jgi:hypothetical protein
VLAKTTEAELKMPVPKGAEGDTTFVNAGDNLTGAGS